MDIHTARDFLAVGFLMISLHIHLI